MDFVKLVRGTQRNCIIIGTVVSTISLPEQQQTHGHHTQGQRKCHQLHHFQTPIPPARSAFPNEWQCGIYMTVNHNAIHIAFVCVCVGR